MPEISVAAVTTEAGRDRRYAVEMAHPDLRLLHAVPKRVGASYGKMRRAIFAALPSLDLASQMMRQQLMPVADAEHGNLGGENSRIDVRTAGLIHTRQDHPR